MGKKAKGRRVAETEAMAVARAIRTSPRKLNLVAQLIRGKAAETALAELSFSRRRIAGDVKKVLQAAIANAENTHQLDVDRLYVKSATVGRTASMRRFHARGRGRIGGIEKPISNLTVIVGERKQREETAKDTAKREEKA
ncbi:MAG: 50S ribosomal protein L22 [Rhodospirillales bacterium]